MRREMTPYELPASQVVLGVDRKRIAGQDRAKRSQGVCFFVWHVTRARRPRDA